MDQSSQHQQETPEQGVALRHATHGVPIEELSSKGLVEYLQQILKVYLSWEFGFPPGFEPCSRRGSYGIHIQYGDGVTWLTRVMVLAAIDDDKSLAAFRKATLLVTHQGALLVESDFTTCGGGRQRHIARLSDQDLEDLLSPKVIEETHTTMTKAIDNRVERTLRTAGRVLGNLASRRLK